jgi:hypothetical protein
MRFVMALKSYARESGAQLLAEGVETNEHLVRARALGARLAQGCHFGWGTELPREASRRRTGTVCIPRVPPISDETPLEVAITSRIRWRTADEDAVDAIARTLELQAAEHHAPAIVLSCFRDADRFTPDTAAHYEMLAELPAFITVFGRGMAADPARQVRGVDVPEGHRLNDELSVVVLTPGFAGMVVARPQGDRYEYIVSDNRAIVIRAARALAKSIVALS